MPRQKSSRSTNHPILCLAAYYLTVGLFIVGMTAPHGRVWGFNWWGYLASPWPYLLLAVSLLAGPAVWYLVGRMNRDTSKEQTTADTTNYLAVAIPFVLLCTALFALFPSTTHFLGDGYQLLSRLADGLGSVKSWDIGASWVNDAVFSRTSGSNQERALTTYRIISVTAGVVTLLVVAMGAAALFKSVAHRMLFLIGVATGGYALMFFGYVENYALLTAMLILYSLLGLLAMRGRCSAWWALPPMLAAAFIHIFGLTLLPSLLYLLLRERRWGQRLAAMSRQRRILIGLSLFVIGLLGYHYLGRTYRFFTFAFLPIIPDQFTVEGDYLLSSKHFLDTLNLLILLVPGLLVMAAGIVITVGRKFFDSAEHRFLLILTLSTLAAVYVFNPGIGMPRNWDLFSIVGVPTVILGYFALLSSASSTKSAILSAALACMLGLMLLGPRVAAQAAPQVAIAHFRDYLELDRIRNRNARRLLADYYEQAGDSAAASRELTMARQEFPESGYNSRGKQYLRDGNIDQAQTALRTAIQLNPLFYDAYANLASCLISRDQLDSALVLLQIADGLNPYNAATIANMGTVYLRQKDFDNALEVFYESLRIDSLNQNGLAGLASSYLTIGEPERSVTFVKTLFDQTDMTSQYYLQAAGAYMDAGFTTQARQAWGYALERGLAPEDIRFMTDRYPQLVE